MNKLSLRQIDDYTILVFAISNIVISLITIIFATCNNKIELVIIQAVIFLYSVLLAYLSYCRTINLLGKIATVVFFTMAYIGLWHYHGIHHVMVILYLISLLNLTLLITRKTTRKLIVFLLLLLIIFNVYYELTMISPSPRPIENLSQTYMVVIAIVIGLLATNLINRFAFEKSLANLEHDNLVDVITGAFNKRAFNQALEKLQYNFQRYQHNFYLVYIDIDSFKTINDHYGHEIGDLVLKECVDYMASSIRATDTIYRVGGDEFIIIFEDFESKYSSNLIERVFEKNHFSCSMDLTITFSIGIASATQAYELDEDIVKLADKRMYSHKHRAKQGT